MPCSRSSGGVCSWGGVPGPGESAPGGCLVQGVPALGGWGGVAFCYGLLLCPSVMTFWFGGLLVWPSGEGQKAITEGHHTRRP